MIVRGIGPEELERCVRHPNPPEVPPGLRAAIDHWSAPEPPAAAGPARTESGEKR